MPTIKPCKRCTLPFTDTSLTANKKYCDTCKHTLRKEKWTIANRNKQNTRPHPHKIQCQICKLFYRKVISHVWQRHNMTGREYKEMIGVDQNKGLIHEDHRNLLHDHALKNKELVIDVNLLRKGVSTRYKKGTPNIGKYKRSAQTLARLKKNRFTIHKNKQKQGANSPKK
jgi:hypothetical protein